MSKTEKRKFRCLACQKERDTDDLVCFRCIQDYVNNTVKATKGELLDRIEDLEKKLKSLKITYEITYEEWKP